MVLFLASFFLAGVNFFINPKRVPWDPSQLNEGEVNLASAMKIAAQSEVVWVDARGQADFELGHIPGALLLNEDDWDTFTHWSGYIDVYFLTPIPEYDRINFLIPTELP